MSSTLFRSIKSQAKEQLHVPARLYKAAYLLLALLSLAACSTSMSQEACYWLQSAATGCREMVEWNPHG
jgi:hypothetical protein